MIINYLPSINSARYTQRIIQTAKSREADKISRPEEIITTPSFTPRSQWVTHSPFPAKPKVARNKNTICTTYSDCEIMDISV